MLFSIPDSNFNKFCEKMEKLNRKAAKHNIPLLTIVSDTEEVIQQEKSHFVVHHIEIDFQKIQINGWEFVATLDIADEEVGVIINRVPNSLNGQDIPEEYRKTTNFCQHCNKNIRRNSVYVLHHETEGFRQVGRTCLQEFLGIDPEMYLNFLQYTMNLHGALNNFSSFANAEKVYELEHVLMVAEQTIQGQGWVSKKMAQEDPRAVPTYTYVVNELHADKPRFNDCELSANGHQALEWIRSMPEKQLNDYFYNLQTVCKLDYIGYKHIGLAISVLPAYYRATTTTPKQEITSKHVGSVGEKIKAELFCYKILSFVGAFGAYDIVMLKNDSGDIFTWKTTTAHQFKVENKYSVGFIVKKHTEWKKIPQTEIKNARIQSLVVENGAKVG